MMEAIVGRQGCPGCGGSGSIPCGSVDGAGMAEGICSCAAQIMWDGRTLWVNGSDGSSIARFGPAGIDIHTMTTDQLDGKSQCLHCVGADLLDLGKRGRAHPLWGEFSKALREHYGIRIPENFG